MRHNKLRLFLAIAFFLWLSLILTAYYVVQKPLFLQVVPGLASTLWTLLVMVLLVTDAAGVGHWLMARLRLKKVTIGEYLFIGTALGLGLFGLLGFGLAATALAKPVVLLTLLIGIHIWLLLSKFGDSIREDIQKAKIRIKEFNQEIPILLLVAAIIAFLLVFTLALAPPGEAFDALLYHLTVPSLWLNNGGLSLVNIPHYWFPSLVEGIFVFPMVLGSDIATQLLHFVFGLLTGGLLLDWSRRLFGLRTAWWTLALLLTIPSLFWLAAWSYTDLALSFYALALLYTIWKWKDCGDNHWLILGGVMAGLAMGVKYTSFPIPLIGLVFILWWGRHEIHTSLVGCLRFSGFAVLIAAPWYIRNWIWTGNPFYPFIFGGPFWDSFRAQAYSGAGTGIGWNILEMFLLPLNITLGYKDANFYDGRIGPFFLILLPVTIWTLWLARAKSSSQRSAFQIITAFVVLYGAFWTFGVTQSSHLWQARLLFPCLLPMVMMMAVGIDHLTQMNTPVLKITYIFSVVIGMVIFLSLLDFGLQVFFRNPLMVSVGSESRQEYIERLQPGYGGALKLVQIAPSNAFIYFLFEPRSYGMLHRLQPDPINDNWAHDFYKYGNVESVINAWRLIGYTHILFSVKGADFITNSNPSQIDHLNQLKDSLYLVGTTPDDMYELYKIPFP